MNFLAHLYLSHDSDHIMVGNFIADFINGEEAASYDENIYKGILLHREIDSFTDRHPQVARGKKLLWTRHRHYSSVIVDIFYDHFLARNWEEHSNIPLEEFASQVYTTLERSEHLLPLKAREVLPRIIAHNWLVNYGKMEGIDRAMQGMASRASFPSQMKSAVEDLRNNYDEFEDTFRTFFPELIHHTKAFLTT
ncbi:MAG: acyl carrier protein phosphodiesterase [Desulfocapsaceae bacterium]|nr:acyl carrier protein phosphodiesterase [Desulfocapsaceae bacterium]